MIDWYRNRSIRDVIVVAVIKLDVTNYLVDGQLPADLVCEWTDGLNVSVGRSTNEFGQAMTEFHGSHDALVVLVRRFETDEDMHDELIGDICG